MFHSPGYFPATLVYAPLAVRLLLLAAIAWLVIPVTKVKRLVTDKVDDQPVSFKNVINSSWSVVLITGAILALSTAATFLLEKPLDKLLPHNTYALWSYAGVLVSANLLLFQAGQKLFPHHFQLPGRLLQVVCATVLAASTFWLLFLPYALTHLDSVTR